MEPLTRAVKALTVAVWCLFLVVLVQLGLHGIGYVRSARLARPASGRLMSGAPVTQPSLPRSSMAVEPSLHDLPPEEMVRRASVILLTSYKKDGDRFRAVVAEVVKREPGIELAYAVGDEIAVLSFSPKDGETYGDGHVVFLVGSPAAMRASYSFDDDRIGGMGDMSLSALRQMARGKPS